MAAVIIVSINTCSRRRKRFKSYTGQWKPTGISPKAVVPIKAPKAKVTESPASTMTKSSRMKVGVSDYELVRPPTPVASVKHKGQSDSHSGDDFVTTTKAAVVIGID